jgi:hypothetical protein
MYFICLHENKMISIGFIVLMMEEGMRENDGGGESNTL